MGAQNLPASSPSAELSLIDTHDVYGNIYVEVSVVSLVTRGNIGKRRGGGFVQFRVRGGVASA